jgi:hypothetical protein
MNILLEGIGVALILSLGGAVIFSTVKLFFSAFFSIFFLITAIAFIYLIYLLWRSPRREGRYTALLIWGLMTASAVLLDLPLLGYFAIQALTVWILRAFLFHRTLLPVFLDAGLTLLSLCAATWAYVSTHSPFLSLWSFFLVQALFCLIPQAQSKRQLKHTNSEQRFERARQSAESALTKLLNQH